jgi:uncharacterized membrane protein
MAPATSSSPVPPHQRAAQVAPPLESRVGLHWLNRVGVITLTIGVAFAFKTAVDNDWLSPLARISCGLGLALVALVAGDVLRRRGQVVFAQGLTGLGLSLSYLSFWASYGLYHLLSQSVVFGLMVGTTIASAGLALRYRAQAIAILALIGGYLTPVVLSTGEPHPLMFFGYLTLLNLGGIALARKRAWPTVEYVAVVATCVLYVGWWIASATPADRPIATAFALVFYAQLAIAPSRYPWQLAQVLGSIAVAIWWRDSHAIHVCLLLLAAGGLAVAELRRFREAPLWTALWLWLLEVIHVVAYATPSTALELAGLTVSFAGFYAWTLRAHMRHDREVGGLDLALLIANPTGYVVAALVVLEPAHHGYSGALVVAVAAAYLALAKLVWHPRTASNVITLGVAIALVTLAVPIQLTGAYVVIAWAVEGAALAWLAARYTSVKLDIAAGAVLVIAVLRFLVVDVDIEHVVLSLTPFANPRFVAAVALAAALLAGARLCRELIPSIVAYIVGHAIALLALGLEIAAWFELGAGTADPFARITVAISILIALYAVMLISLGVIRRRALDRVLGLALMAIVVGKLYLSDVWSVGRAFQVIAFLGLGVLLLLISYLYSRYRDVIERLWKDESLDQE